MKLKNIGSNQTQITTANGNTILFSYSTPVAANLHDGGFIRTATKYSRTTSKHINQWLAGANAKEVQQSEIDALV